MPTDYREYPVLVVDDEDHNLVTLRYVLGPEFTIVSARSGEEALDILRERDVAVMLTDQKMPDMDGIELCARARKLRPETVRMVVTAYPSVEKMSGAINLGNVSRYMEKPWKPDPLRELLRATIDIVCRERALRQMELRLVRGDAGVSALRQEYLGLVRELGQPFRAVRAGLDSAAAALAVARKKLAWSQDPTAREALALVAEADAHLGGLAPAMQQIEAIEAAAHGGEAGRSEGTSPSAAKECDAARAVEAAVRLTERGLPVRAEIRLDLAEGVIVPLSAAALGEIVSNLLSNAVDAVRSIERPSRRAPIVVRLRIEDDDAVLTVTDKGPGIPPEEIDSVFMQGYTTKASGVGYGLNVVQRFVEEAEGSVDVRSTLKKGTTFEVRLPFRKRAAE